MANQSANKKKQKTGRRLDQRDAFAFSYLPFDTKVLYWQGNLKRLIKTLFTSFTSVVLYRIKHQISQMAKDKTLYAVTELSRGLEEGDLFLYQVVK